MRPIYVFISILFAYVCESDSVKCNVLHSHTHIVAMIKIAVFCVLLLKCNLRWNAQVRKDLLSSKGIFVCGYDFLFA